jgi:hypothetical protein
MAPTYMTLACGTVTNSNIKSPLYSTLLEYNPSSIILLQLLSNVILPPGCKLFIADAKAMYTNIPTKPALLGLSQYLCSDYSHILPTVQREALFDAALSIVVMRNNIFTFGDTHWHQQDGTAMCAPLPPRSWTVRYTSLLTKTSPCLARITTLLCWHHHPPLCPMWHFDKCCDMYVFYPSPLSCRGLFGSWVLHLVALCCRLVPFLCLYTCHLRPLVLCSLRAGALPEQLTASNHQSGGISVLCC